MKAYFDDLQPIEKSEFLNRYAAHINEREKPDEFEKTVLQRLEGTVHLACYLAKLNEKGCDNLILPHHATTLEPGDPDRAVKDGGDTFRNVVRNFLEHYIPADRFSKCTKKIQEQNSFFFGKGGPV